MEFKQTAILSGVLLLSACVSSGIKVSDEQMKKFEVGKTTEAQVVAALGQPNGVTTSTDGTRIDVYTHVDAHANAASFIPVVGIFAAGAKSTADSVVFHFDARGVLTSTSSTRAQNNVNTGLANQQ